jgi:hypothetical protein
MTNFQRGSLGGKIRGNRKWKMAEKTGKEKKSTLRAFALRANNSKGIDSSLIFLYYYLLDVIP